MENDKAIAKALLRHEEELRTILKMLNLEKGIVEFDIYDNAVEISVIRSHSKGAVFFTSFAVENKGG